jgi:hypothetical protein
VRGGIGMGYDEVMDDECFADVYGDRCGLCTSLYVLPLEQTVAEIG